MIINKSELKETPGGFIEHYFKIFSPIVIADFKKSGVYIFLSTLPNGDKEMWPGIFDGGLVEALGLSDGTVFQILGVDLIDRYDATHWGHVSVPARRVIEIRKGRI